MKQAYNFYIEINLIQILDCFKLSLRIQTIVLNNIQIQNQTRSLVQNVIPNQNCQQNLIVPTTFVNDLFKGDINTGTSEGTKLYIKTNIVIPEDDKF